MSLVELSGGRLLIACVKVSNQSFEVDVLELAVAVISWGLWIEELAGDAPGVSDD